MKLRSEKKESSRLPVQNKPFQYVVSSRELVSSGRAEPRIETVATAAAPGRLADHTQVDRGEPQMTQRAHFTERDDSLDRDDSWQTWESLKRRSEWTCIATRAVSRCAGPDANP